LAVSRGGAQVDVPLSVRDVLTRIADVLASGRGVAIVPVDRELTTTEAAGLLGVSRPTLIKLLEAGEIGYSRPNSSRRIPLDQVLAYRDRRGQARRAILDELTADAVVRGMYGEPAPAETDDAA
jgi:excisionase family DNA binding protein